MNVAGTEPAILAVQPTPETLNAQANALIDIGVTPLTVEPVAVSTAVFVHAIVVAMPPGAVHEVNLNDMSLLIGFMDANVATKEVLEQLTGPSLIAMAALPVTGPVGDTVALAAPARIAPIAMDMTNVVNTRRIVAPRDRGSCDACSSHGTALARARWQR